MTTDSDTTSASTSASTLHIYIIAGEPSGDLLGARLMESLQQQTNGQIRFSGIGGEQMAKAGLRSLFPYHELALMGFVEILPHLKRLLGRIRQTTTDIQNQRPDCVITIDSPGFCFRVTEKLHAAVPASALPKLVHYVAPTVWAYKPKRALKVKQLYDFLLLLLPFEPPYFERIGLPHRFVGHPIVREWRNHQGNGPRFREKHGILPGAAVLTLLAGSRRTELKRHLPIFAEVASRLCALHPQLTTVMVTPPYLEAEARAALATMPGHMLIVSNLDEKRDVFAASTLALAKSGTVTLELSLAHVPLVVTYKVSAFSAWLMRRMIQVPFVNLLNLIAARPIIPELLQESCNVDDLTAELERLLSQPEARTEQINAVQQALDQLDSLTDLESPSDKAAASILELLS